MDGIHDLGGMHGFGPVTPGDDHRLDPADWRARMFGIELSYSQPGGFNLDWLRHAMECMPPGAYLACEYYDRWYWRDAGILAQAGCVSLEELRPGRMVAPPPVRPMAPMTPEQAEELLQHGIEGRQPPLGRERFQPGDQVRAPFHDPLGATRTIGSARIDWRATLSRAEPMEQPERNGTGDTGLSASRLSEPWQAQVLALAIALQESGRIDPAAWSAALAAQLARAEHQADPAAPESYGASVLCTLETLLEARGILNRPQVTARQRQWEQAHLATPHGQPVVLSATDRGPGSG